MEGLGIIMFGMWIAGVFVGAGIGIQIGKYLKTNENIAKKAKEIDDLVNGLK